MIFLSAIPTSHLHHLLIAQVYYKRLRYSRKVISRATYNSENVLHPYRSDSQPTELVVEDDICKKIKPLRAKLPTMEDGAYFKEEVFRENPKKQLDHSSME